MNSISRADCERLDALDPLAHVRDRFALPPDTIYLDGNSLGALPCSTPARIAQAIEHWGNRLIRAWLEAKWLEAPQRVGAMIAPLIGAADDEVIVIESTTIALFKAAAAAVQCTPDREVIITEAGNFPTDAHILQSISELTGVHIRTVEAYRLEEEIQSVGENLIAVVLTHVNYRTGAMHNMAALTAATHQTGALMIWDLAHSAGAVELDLNGCGVDLAVGCGYKYLNGGPGAPAFLMVAKRLQDQLENPLGGWLGTADPFAMAEEWIPAPGILQFITGSPAMLSLLALEEGVSTFAGLEMKEVRAKSLALSKLFIDLIDQRLEGHGFIVASPRSDIRRGSQVSLSHLYAAEIIQALIVRGVIGDYREPAIARFGFTPLYLRYVDVWDAVNHLHEVMINQEFQVNTREIQTFSSV
jgi:kynureninase